MPGIIRPEDRNARDQDKSTASAFDVASSGDEFHGDNSALQIDMSDLECEPLLVSDLNEDLSIAMQSTVHV